jgi:primosomal protein N' (replication factor Y)
LITQVAGRAGRGEYSGKVIVQTYDPEHYSILAALHQDYEEFYNKEILIRKTFNYPPFTDLINIIVSSKIEKEAEDAIRELTDMIKKTGYDGEDFSILGPSPAPISKINTYFRWQTIIKGNANNSLKSMIRTISNLKNTRNKKVRVNIDINPVNLL